MKAVIALTMVAGALAVPAWSDAPVKETSTAVDPKTWLDVTATSTVVDPAKTWLDVPAAETSTSTWADGTWSDAPVDPTTTSTATWADYTPVTYTVTVTDKVTTYCTADATFTDKHDVYTVTKGETKTLTHGPYTITIPISYETKTVCDEPVAPTVAASTWLVVPAPVAPTTTAKPVSPATPKPVSPVDSYKGAASKMTGAGLAGVVAIAALLL